MMSRAGLLGSAALAATLFAVPTGAMSFTPLGFLPGGSRSVANAISNDGTTVVGATSGSAFRWTATTGMVALGNLPGGGSGAEAVSSNGSVIAGGGSSTNYASEAISWTAPAYTPTSLLHYAGPAFTSAYGASADGSVIVGISGEAVRWVSGGAPLSLGTGTYSYAWDVSNDGGAIVGMALFPNHDALYEAFRWTALTGAVRLGDLAVGNEDSRALGVSGDGNTIVGASGGRAFAWTAGTGMYALSNGASEARDASGDGGVFVGYGYGSGSRSAALWNVLAPGWEYDLNQVAAAVLPAGWKLEDAFGVSADGLSIVGSGTNPLGATEAWLLRLDTVPVPEPGTGALLGLGVVMLGVKRRCR
jgi:uncharacterized membrane protein